MSVLKFHISLYTISPNNLIAL